MKILIAGDTGLLGQALVRFLAPSNEVEGFSTTPKARLDGCPHTTLNILREPSKADELIRRFSPDLIINCIGAVDLKKCEEGKDSSWEINAELPGLLARSCLSHKIRYIHISTDQVFDGKSVVPYEEVCGTNPLNKYGMSKLVGERGVLAENPSALILRTNIVGWRAKEGVPTFAEWLSSSLFLGHKISLADDFVTSSIHVDYLSEILMDLYKKGAAGIFHAASGDSISKYEFGRLLAEFAGLNFSNVERVRLSQLGLHPPRPPYLALSVKKAENFLGRKFPVCAQTISLLAEQFSREAKGIHENKK